MKPEANRALKAMPRRCLGEKFQEVITYHQVIQHVGLWRDLVETKEVLGSRRS